MDDPVKYPWQAVIMDALLESRPENFRWKVVAIERALSERVRALDTLDQKEADALGGTLKALPILFPGEKARWDRLVELAQE